MKPCYGYQTTSKVLLKKARNERTYRIKGLKGSNPFEFLAALGVQFAYEFRDVQPRLWWTDGAVPHACIDGEFSVKDVAKQVMETLHYWRQSAGLNPRDDLGNKLSGGRELKMSHEDARLFLKHALSDKYVGRFYMSLIAEGSVAGNGKTKPSDLYFVSARQTYLQIVSDVINKVEESDVVSALQEGGRVESEHPTLKLDILDDPVYALTDKRPDGTGKYLNLGIEALAILGLSRYPVYGRLGRTLTQGCSGTWKNGTFDWPIWEQPSSVDMVHSLISASTPYLDSRSELLGAWSILRIYRSVITRNDYAYGTFKPPSVVWQRLTSRRENLERQNRKKLSALETLVQEAETNGLSTEALAKIANFDD